ATDRGLEAAVMAARVPPAAYAGFDGWRDATQRYQAELIRRQIEELRRLKYRPAGGFLQVRLADAAPAIGFGVLDDDGRPKAGWDALVAACRPVIVVADRLPATVAAGEAPGPHVPVGAGRRGPIAPPPGPPP